MSCIVISGPSFEEAERQIANLEEHAALFEFRLDYFSSRNLQAIASLQSKTQKPVIFTLRSTSMRGCFQGREEDRLLEIEQLCQLNPAYVDIESHIHPHFIRRLKEQFPHIKVICSHHDFQQTPKCFTELHSFLKTIPADLYKIATFAHCPTDAFRLMLYTQKMQDVIGISMGENGALSRLLSSRFNNAWTYFGASTSLAPGQQTVKEIQSIYGDFQGKKHLYGLIGGQTRKSISHWTHNALMRLFALEGIYLKMDVTVGRLPVLLQQMKECGWLGLSVTMPLKEAILPYIDEIDKDAAIIGAVNTISFHSDKLRGFNTDGVGALQAIEKKCRVNQKKIAVIGCGGASKAIIYEACLRGGQVTIFNRNLDKAEQVAEKLQCYAMDIRSLHAQDFDIIINCTPLENPVEDLVLHKKCLVMDINTMPKQSILIKKALQSGCQVIYGYEMFVNQACLQFRDWFPFLGLEALQNALQKECLKHLGG
ncbi:Shikimate biosynthesis protein AroDE [Chlamydiales bacterium STE3]|nr:Shikimate biosynthesis protein AroDE [Chlamydiales bacterium STE3]